MIRTYTSADLATLSLPGSLPGLLEGWCGRVEILEHGDDDEWKPATACGGDWWAITNGPHEGELGNRGTVRGQRLPLSRWECRIRVVAWLAEGQACPEPDHLIQAARGGDCPRCPGSTGYLRAPADLRWALDWPGQPLPAWQSGAILHASALRVAAGMEPIRGMHLQWKRKSAGSNVFYWRRPGGLLSWEVLGHRDFGWRSVGKAAGMETGEAGKAAADAAALAAGYALAGANGDTLTVEVP